MKPARADKRASSQTRLRIKCQAEPSLSSTYFKFLEFSFVNGTQAWLRIESVEIAFGRSKAQKGVFVPLGADLAWWGRAALQQQAVDDHNRRLVFQVIASVGDGLHNATRSPHRGPGAGDRLAHDRYSLRTLDDLMTDLRDVQGTAVIPEGHLLAGPVVVPPGLFSKHWMVIHMRDPDVLRRQRHAIIRLTFADGHTERFKLEF